jgi:hypothetical protein
LPGAGNILTFNNGDRPGTADDYSTVAEIVPPVDEFGNYTIGPAEPFGPEAPIWTHGDPAEYYGSPAQCGAFRLPNGNTLISLSEGGIIFEVTQAGSTVWEYDHPTENIPRSQRYWDENAAVVDGAGGLGPRMVLKSVAGCPNPSTGSMQLSFEVSEQAHVDFRIFDIAGRCVAELHAGEFAIGKHRLSWDGWDGRGLSLSAGIYFIRVSAAQETKVRKLVLIR